MAPLGGWWAAELATVAVAELLGVVTIVLLLLGDETAVAEELGAGEAEEECGTDEGWGGEWWG